MRFGRFGILTIMILSTIGCSVGHQVLKMPQKDQGGKEVDFDQAAYYSLPRTVLIVNFPVKKTSVLKGTGKSGSPEKSCFDQLSDPVGDEFTDALPDWLESKYRPANLLQAIGLKELPIEGKKSFEVTAAPSISTLSEPDPDQVFRVELSSKWSQKREVNLKFGPMGTLQSGTSFVQDQRVDLAVAFAKTILNIGSTVAFKAVPADRMASDETEAKATDFFRCGTIPDSCRQSACEILEARAGLISLPNRVTAAKLDADQATWLTNRFKEDLDKKLPVFVRFREQIANVVCAFRPQTTNAATSLVSIDESEGFQVASGTAVECLIPPGFEATGNPVNLTTYVVEVEVPQDQLVESFRKRKLDHAQNDLVEQGFYYRIPAAANITVKKANEKVAEDQKVIAQLGLVAALPRQKTYQTKYQVSLDPATGALVELTSTSTPVDPALITGAGDAVAGFLAKKKEAEEKEAAAKDELAQLERQRKILEEKYKIRDFEQKLAENGEGGN